MPAFAFCILYLRRHVCYFTNWHKKYSWDFSSIIFESMIYTAYTGLMVLVGLWSQQREGLLISNHTLSYLVVFMFPLAHVSYIPWICYHLKAYCIINLRSAFSFFLPWPCWVFDISLSLQHRFNLVICSPHTTCG